VTPTPLKRRPLGPPPPPGLSSDAKARWTAVNAMWALGPDGITLLVIHVEAMTRRARAWERVQAEGLTITSRGGPRPHPLLAVVRDAENVMLKAWRQLNLSAPPPQPIGRPPGRTGSAIT
jgi:phage terminase small subunit